MRIGIDARLWSESGVGRYTRNLVFALSEIDTKNTYVLFFNDPEYKNVPIRSSRMEKKLVNIRWHTFEEQLRMTRIISSANVDLMHFPYFSAPLLYNRPFVITIHDLILHHFPTGEASTLAFPLYLTKLLVYKLVVAKAARSAKKILTVSETTKKEIIDHLKISEKKITVAYEGVDEGLLKKPQPLTVCDSYLLYVGNAYPHKNLKRFLAAAALLKSSLQDTKIYLVGRDDFFYRRLRQEVKHMGLTKQIVFFGNADDSSLSYLYKHTKALVSPSLMEGFDLPLLEAMVNRTPVIASDIPVHREIGGLWPYYFPPNDTYALAKAIEKILSLKRQDLGERKEKDLRQVFSWRRMAEKTLSVYREVLSNS